MGFVEETAVGLIAGIKLDSQIQRALRLQGMTLLEVFLARFVVDLCPSDVLRDFSPNLADDLLAVQAAGSRRELTSPPAGASAGA